MKIFATVVLFSMSLSFSALAQLAGSVSFDKKAPAVPVVQEGEKAVPKQRPAFDKNKRLQEQLSKADVFDNPRFAKKAYGGLQGTQQAIQAEQKRVVDEKTFATAEEKAAFEQELQDKALIKFQNFEEDSKNLNKQMNEQPLAKIQEVTDRISYIDPTKATPEANEETRERVEAVFESREGISPTEYMQLYQQQLEEQANQPVPAGELENKARFSEGAAIEVEKVDEQNARIQPTAKKASRP